MYQEHFKQALNYGRGDFKGNLLNELKSFFQLNVSEDDELYKTCRSASDTIALEWKKKKINPKDEKAVTQFYLDTPWYCYELIGLEIDITDSRQEQLKAFVQLLKQNGKLKGCDYGSGVGTLGIYLNKNGIHCDFADVSETNLKFISERLNRRAIQNVNLIPLKKEKLKSHYDFITAFDVLEHVTHPDKLIEELTSYLNPGGFFIFNLLYHNEDDTPHLLKDPDLIRKKIRSFGLRKIGQLGEFKIYQKVSRPAWLNRAVYAFDRAFWELRKKIKG